VTFYAADEIYSVTFILLDTYAVGGENMTLTIMTSKQMQEFVKSVGYVLVIEAKFGYDSSNKPTTIFDCMNDKSQFCKEQAASKIQALVKGRQQRKVRPLEKMMEEFYAPTGEGATLAHRSAKRALAKLAAFEAKSLDE